MGQRGGRLITGPARPALARRGVRKAAATTIGWAVGVAALLLDMSVFDEFVTKRTWQLWEAVGLGGLRDVMMFGLIASTFPLPLLGATAGWVGGLVAKAGQRA